jgi:hypothetical protein
LTRYLVAIHHPDGYDGSLEDEAMHRDIDALNEEIEGAGVRVFAGGLTAASNAKSLRAQPDGKVLITDGPLPRDQGARRRFWLLEAAELDEALAWGRKAAIACRAPVEVRVFFGASLTASIGIIEVKSNEEAIQWAALAHSQEENDAEKEDRRNRNQMLRTACRARQGVPAVAQEAKTP